MSNLIKFIPDFKVTQHISMLESGQVEDWGYKYVNIAKYREMTNTCGEDIKVVILDTGSNPSHPDLKDNVKGEQDFTGDNCPLDSVGHSSHVAGIIGGIDNGIGVIGIAPKSSLYFGKVLNNQGLCPPDYSWIIKGLEWAIDIKADIVNMSLGAHIQPPEKMQKLVRSAAAQGIILVAASGNSQMQTIDYPGRYNEVISVAAMDKNGQLASYSNVGQELDFLAPGSDIYSTYLNGGYSKISGTCLPETVGIFTDCGRKTLGEINVGDTVISCDPNSLNIVKNKIARKWSNGIKQTYKIKTSNWSLEATGNHPILTLNIDTLNKTQGCGLAREYSFIWKKLEDLTLQDHILYAHNIDFDENNFVDSIPSADFAQLLGFMIGDGWISNPKSGMYMISFARGVYDNINVEYENLLRKFSVNKVSLTKDKQQTYTFDKKLYYALSHFGMDNGAKHKRLPEEIFKCSLDIRKAFIIGYLDADGTSPKKVSNGTICFSSASRELVLDIKYLLATMGAQTANIYHRYRKSQIQGRKIEGHEYSTTICRSEIEKIFDIIDNTVDRTRRSGGDVIDSQIFKQNIINSPFRIGKISSIEILGEKEVFDIEMENQEYPCFIADGIIVHNSMSAPFLSGIVALLLSYHRNGDEHHTPINSYVEVIEHIKKFEKGRVIDLGGDKGIGILDFSADPEKNITLSSIQKDMNFQIWQHITKDLFIKWVKRILRR